VECCEGLGECGGIESGGGGGGGVEEDRGKEVIELVGLDRRELGCYEEHIMNKQ
jgi:hypothetical protein